MSEVKLSKVNISEGKCQNPENFGIENLLYQKYNIELSLQQDFYLLLRDSF